MNTYLHEPNIYLDNDKMI